MVLSQPKHLQRGDGNVREQDVAVMSLLAFHFYGPLWLILFRSRTGTAAPGQGVFAIDQDKGAPKIPAAQGARAGKPSFGPQGEEIRHYCPKRLFGGLKTALRAGMLCRKR